MFFKSVNNFLRYQSRQLDRQTDRQTNTGGHTKYLRIWNFHWNWIMNWIGGTIQIRIESRIESGCSRLRVQCRLPQESCRTTTYHRELPYYMLRCKVIVNVMVVSCINQHKINLNNKLQRRNGWSFLLNSERGLWYDCRFGSGSNQPITFESNWNCPIRILKLHRSLRHTYVPKFIGRGNYNWTARSLPVIWPLLGQTFANRVSQLRPVTVIQHNYVSCLSNYESKQ